MIQVKSIEFDRVEGLREECGPRTFFAWTTLHAHVRSAARTAPADGSYDKCDVTVKWADGTSFKFRFDLNSTHTQEHSPVRDELYRTLTFYAGRERPSHLSEQQYKTLLQAQERVQSGIGTWMSQILDGGYDLGVRA